MANYPDWVMEHKKKGTYVNKVGETYYLYAAHSEREKGTGKVRRVSDGYLGRITEKDGFIPAKEKVSQEPLSYEIGLSYAIIHAAADIQKGLRRSYRKYGDIIFSCAILSFIHGEYSEELFGQSYLHILYPEPPYPESFSKPQIVGIERGLRMLEESLPRMLGDDLPRISAHFPNIRLLEINRKYYLSPLSETASLLSEKHGIDWRNPLWQR